MADEEAEGADNASGGKSKTLLLIIVGIVLIGASIGGTIFVLGMLKPEPVPVDPDAVEEVAVDTSSPAIYYPLKPEYILNIDARGRRRYMRLDITLMTRDDEVIAAIEMHRASIDNTITMIGGGQIFEEIQTAEGKELLRLQLLKELQMVFEREIGQKGIEQVLFTNFVMQ